MEHTADDIPATAAHESVSALGIIDVAVEVGGAMEVSQLQVLMLR